MFKDAIEAIGRIDSNHLFFIEGILLLTMNTAVVHLKAPNLVYGTHVYEGSLVPPHWDGDPTFLRSRFQQRAKEAAEVPAPLWGGELGYDLGAAGTCSASSQGDATAGRLTLQVDSGKGCQVTLHAG